MVITYTLYPFVLLNWPLLKITILKYSRLLSRSKVITVILRLVHAWRIDMAMACNREDYSKQRFIAVGGRLIPWPHVFLRGLVQTTTIST